MTEKTASQRGKTQNQASEVKMLWQHLINYYHYYCNTVIVVINQN